MRVGVVEGFYGPLWSPAERGRFLQSLAEINGATYLYAPKGDRSLRRDWAEPFDEAQLHALATLRDQCHKLGLHFGIGISPLGLAADIESSASRSHWRAKARQIAALGCDELWLLFDDMPVTRQPLAAAQLQIFEIFAAEVGAARLAVCPGFYCFDPILEKLFGARPVEYWSTLGAGLPASTDILWTGNGVLNETIVAGDCQRAADALGRPPLIWDNYPVNDGRRTADFLHLDAFRGRDFVTAEAATGHFMNPMVQPALSQIVLSSFRDLHRDSQTYDPALSRQTAFAALPSPLATLLVRDWQTFAQCGRLEIGDSDRARLIEEYGSIDHPAAGEIRRWLDGEYRFDPEVLND